MPSPPHQWARSHLKVAAFSFFPPRLRKKIEIYSKIHRLCLCTYTHCHRWASLLPQVTLLRYRHRGKKLFWLRSYHYRGIKTCRLLRYRYKTNGELKCRSCYVSVRVPNSFATTDHLKKYKYPTVLKRLRIFFPSAKIFGLNNRKIFNIVSNTGAYILPVTCYISPQTKFNGYISTVSNVLSRIVTSYQDIKCTRPSRYSLHRYFPKHDF